jgi:uncharacterized protein Veg
MSGLLLHVSPALAAKAAAPSIQAFKPGEKLTYSITWSNIIQAGSAVMEVRKEKTADGQDAYRFISSAWSVGWVGKLYRVKDRVQSLFSPRELSSLSYQLDQRHGRKKKQRELLFDHEKKVVISSEGGRRETTPISGNTQDALSSVYFLRLMNDFNDRTPIVINVFDSGKAWPVEVHTVGREKIKTPVGEFNTIKVRTNPPFEGVFMHKGEIIMWLTDDARKIPVLMRSTVSIGSIVATITGIHTGDDAP